MSISGYFPVRNRAQSQTCHESRVPAARATGARRQVQDARSSLTTIVLRVGLSHLINKEADMTVCGRRETGAGSGVSGARPALTDLCLGDSDGLDLTQGLKGQFPNLPILLSCDENLAERNAAPPRGGTS